YEEQFDDGLVDRVKEKIFSHLRYNKTMTYSDYLREKGMKLSEREAFLKSQGIDGAATVYDVFKQANPEASDEEIRKEIRDDYAAVKLANCQNNNTGKWDEYYANKIFETTTVTEFFALIDYHKDKVDEFCAQNNCEPDAPVWKLFVNDFIKKQEDKNKQLIGNHNVVSETEKDNLRMATLDDGEVVTLDKVKKPEDVTFHDTNRNMAAYLVNTLRNDNKLGMTYGDTVYNTFKGSLSLDDKECYNKGEIIFNAVELKAPKFNKEPNKLNDEEKRYIEFGNKVAKDVIKDKAANVVKTFYDINSVLTNGAPIQLLNEPEFIGYNNNAVGRTDPTFLRGIVKTLEDTGVGSGLFHTKSNSNNYEEMLKAIKVYLYKMASNDTDGIMDLRTELINKCKNYISDKKTVRQREFGRIRFDAAVTVLYSVMPANEFKTQVMDSINNARGVGPGNATGISRNKCINQYSEYRIKGLEIENNRQEASYKDSTKMGISYHQKLAKIAAYYTRRPDIQSSYGDDEAFMKDFPVILDRFNRVGPSDTAEEISEGDFIAVAYAGALSPEATVKDGRLANKGGDKALLTGKDYTTEIAKDANKAKLYKDVINAGRETAVNALKDYQNGQKETLACTLWYGIRFVVAQARLMKKADDDIVILAEMGSRMVNMLERDPELKKLAITIGGLQEDGIRHVKSLKVQSRIYQNSVDAFNKLNTIKKEIEAGNNVELDDKAKAELVSDIIIQKVLDEGREFYNKAIDKTTKYKNGMAKVKKAYNEKMENNAINMNNLENLSQNERDEVVAKARNEGVKAKRDAYDEYRCDELYWRDNCRNNSLNDSLAEEKNVKDIEKSVKEFVKSSGLLKKNVSELLESLTKDERIMPKIAAVIEKNHQSIDQTEIAKRRVYNNTINSGVKLF
ncbi:MAG: hypothetical protein K5656_01605, partial [Lachnospiraceae bacterium]|nr:hypothetical protein [Lachnospiraceae bacterium]